ncbi:PREDICTED: GPI transamidase component PIG-S-like [Amphimedon queenslandica]|uniref:GPI transamidase component PIG-S n=1 Tax=Amphimedon queenslandica TaxID=400682 RepID=A0A1X7VI53_AMPQE|nr:PREDICTED: GPI transamidase component PIG-S-like [Amphimedon queenslandica]|eukprot:XP_011410130.2 PREDICTED: GPI transamidase component PIG-S-like [Amphimedon queenslandica]
MVYSRGSVSLLSIVCVWLFLGLPVWWKTTTVYRSTLPHSWITSLQHEQQVLSVLSCNISAISLITGLDLSSFIKNTSYFTIFNKDSVINVHSLVKEYRGEPLSIEDLLNKESVSNPVGHYSLIVTRALEYSTQYKNERNLFIEYINNTQLQEDINDSVYKLCGVETFNKLLNNSNKKESLRRMKISPGYDISIVVISSADSAVSEWNIDISTNQLLLPFLKHNNIKKIANFTISSQLLYFTDVEFMTSEDINCHTVSPAHVPHMISKVDAKLGSTVSQWPRLTFVVYVPHPTQRPLLIRNRNSDNTDSFLVPQWGGVIFYNDYVQTRENDTISVDMNVVMPTIVRQLKLLLGINDEHKSETSPPYNLHAWDIDHLLMIQTLERLSLTKVSLVSLIQLLDNVKNMVISDHIQTEVVQSLNDLNKCVASIADGQWSVAHSQCETALDHAEVAFFDPTILALLYFPDDQKYAIYIPLFLPVGFPVLLSLIKLLKSWRQSRHKEKTS